MALIAKSPVIESFDGCDSPAVKITVIFQPHLLNKALPLLVIAVAFLFSKHLRTSIAVEEVLIKQCL